MILVDTSIWRRHFRARDDVLIRLLGENRVLTHDGVLHELILGGVASAARSSLLALRRLPTDPGGDILAGIDRHPLAQTGLGAIDAQLFLAALRAGVGLYTADAALSACFAPFQPSPDPRSVGGMGSG